MQVKEIIFILFFADTGQSERKSEGNINLQSRNLLSFQATRCFVVILGLLECASSKQRIILLT